MSHCRSYPAERGPKSVEPSIRPLSDQSFDTLSWLSSQTDDEEDRGDPGSRVKRLRITPLSPPLTPKELASVVPADKPDLTHSDSVLPSTPPRTRQKGRSSSEGLSLPSPPESENGDMTEDFLGITYPARPRPLLYGNFPSFETGRGSGELRRVRNSPLPRAASSASPDRFISNRTSPHDSTQNFRLGKSPHLLTPTERLLRHDSATPDPFLSSPRRARQGRSLVSSSESRRTDHSQRSSRSGQDVLMLPHHAHPPPHRRQASIGAVWNVGGGIASPTGPVGGVPDGRGGLIGRGTNAPLYTAKFSEKDPPKTDQDIFDNRLAVALGIDRTRKVLDISQPPKQSNEASAGKRRRAEVVQRTQWRNGEWSRPGDISLDRNTSKKDAKPVPSIPFRVLDAPQLRDDYYCSVLAYCHTKRTLAVGLCNKVYLWSEVSGVQYPPEGESTHRSHVTSLSFSSTEGGHSILAMGRSSGHVSLWSLWDEGSRFESQQPSAIACLSFKPVTTLRTSVKFGVTVPTEELLVGDEFGNVYYYAIEWVDGLKVDIHGWHGSMKLLAKISVHSQQICGLAWSHCGGYFATGANDNACCLFVVKKILASQRLPERTHQIRRQPLQMLKNHGLPDVLYSTPHRQTLNSSLSHASSATEVPPISLAQRAPSNPFIFRAIPGQNGILNISEGQERHRWMHSAAIKAIAFCPWQPGLIAIGGGSNDRGIHFYHILSGACLATINVQAQVTSLIWSTTRHEIAATFGYAQPEHPYRIAVFSWPECRQVVAIPWGNDMRALHAIPYPGGPNEKGKRAGEGEAWWSRTSDEGCIVVACSDESVKFHEVWTGKKRGMGLGGLGVRQGMLGGSDILEALEGVDKQGKWCIR